MTKKDLEMKEPVTHNYDLDQEVGICPVCGSPDLHYDSLKIDTLQVGYPWICNTCKSSGEEWYDLHFIEHTNIKKIPMPQISLFDYYKNKKKEKVNE